MINTSTGNTVTILLVNIEDPPLSHHFERVKILIAIVFLYWTHSLLFVNNCLYYVALWCRLLISCGRCKILPAVQLISILGTGRFIDIFDFFVQFIEFYYTELYTTNPPARSWLFPNIYEVYPFSPSINSMAL